MKPMIQHWHTGVKSRGRRQFLWLRLIKDYGQLVSENIKIYKPGYQGGDAEIWGPTEVCAKWNIEKVSQVIDILGLMGDSVDNISGHTGCR